MAKIEITAVIKLTADVPEEMLNKGTKPEEAHHVAHNLFAMGVSSMPCPAYKPAILLPDGTWAVQVEAEIQIDRDGEAHMDIPKGERAASSSHAHMH